MHKILRFIYHLGYLYAVERQNFQFSNFQGIGVQFAILTRSKIYLRVKFYIHGKAKTLGLSYLPKNYNENIFW